MLEEEVVTGVAKLETSYQANIACFDILQVAFQIPPSRHHQKSLGNPTMTSNPPTITTYGQFNKICGTFPDDKWINNLATFTAVVARSPAPSEVRTILLAQQNCMW